MIFCDSADISESGFDALLCFASQLRSHGLPAVISDTSIPERTKKSQQFELVNFLTRVQPGVGDDAVLIAAEALDSQSQSRISSAWRAGAMKCTAFGRFSSYQEKLNAQTRLAYALSREPEVHEVDIPLGLHGRGIPVFRAQLRNRKQDYPKLALFFPDLSDGSLDPAIKLMAHNHAFDLEIVTDGQSKTAWKERNGDEIAVWHLGEMLPHSFAARYDMVALFGQATSWPRFQMVMANLIGSGSVLIDCTFDRVWSSIDPIFIRGTPELSVLGAWISQELVVKLPVLSKEVVKSGLCRKFDIPDVLHKLKCTSIYRADNPSAPDECRILFVPTNGVGLGHAKRCSLVADAMRTDVKPVFAAFPSCVGMLTRAGFDTAPLIGRSDLKASHSNDLVNTTRIGALARKAGGVVFDGGYVFDSIVRAICDNGLPSVWIRRGLWQEQQNNSVALDRQKHFTSVVVPEEAFEELNSPVSPALATHVGPIVHLTRQSEADRTELRSKVMRKLGRPAERLVVTMLGGGVAADRTAQTNSIAAHLSRYDDVLNLIVTWPTAQVHPSWYHFENTRVVTSFHASPLVQSCDLFISAVGYNSFHEALYGGVPSIFVPQMAGYMDDQRARATSAADRDLAVLAEPWDVLSLNKQIDELLEGKTKDLRTKLRRFNLPEPGTRAAASHILEVIK